MGGCVGYEKVAKASDEGHGAQGEARGQTGALDASAVTTSGERELRSLCDEVEIAVRRKRKRSHLVDRAIEIARQGVVVGRGSFGAVYGVGSLAVKVCREGPLAPGEIRALGLTSDRPHDNLMDRLLATPDIVVMPRWGRSLAGIVSDMADGDRPDPTTASRWVRQCAAGLRHMHLALQVTHGDLHAGNVLCDEDSGVVRLADFGASRRLDGSRCQYVGRCMRWAQSPRLASDVMDDDGDWTRHPGGAVDDLWSLGTLAYFCDTATHMFPGDSNWGLLILQFSHLGTLPTDPGRYPAMRRAGAFPSFRAEPRRSRGAAGALVSICTSRALLEAGHSPASAWAAVEAHAGEQPAA